MTSLCVAQALHCHPKQDRSYTCNVTLICVRVRKVAVEKRWVVRTVSGCVSSRVIRHADPVFPAPCYGVTCGRFGSIMFFHIISTWTISEKKNIENKMCNLILPTFFSGKLLLLRRIQWDIIINLQGTSLHVKYPLFFSDFNPTWIFSTEY